MNQRFSRIHEQVSQWLYQSNQQGWVDDHQLQALQNIEQQRADELFSASGERPLIIAFFGGTGVGKSTLLNRLAGENIAVSGVERPTSREVTLFLHRDFELRNLPQEIPNDSDPAKNRIQYHDDDSRRAVAWLDLPDIDSTAQEHQELVIQWLPYIDWVIYVVSPERYHDDIGWRFLQERKNKHRWLFIINHWDQGIEVQRTDFTQRLIAEGFNNPTVLTTDCGPNPVPDDFALLEQTINSAIQEYGLSFLQSQGEHARLKELKHLLHGLEQQIGSNDQWQQAKSPWVFSIDRRLESLESELQTNAHAVGQRLLVQEASQSNGFSLRKRLTATPAALPAPQDLSNEVWGSRSKLFTKDLGLELAGGLRKLNLPYQVAEQQLESWSNDVYETMKLSIDQNIAEAMAQPGNAIQRAAFKFMKFLSWLLPLGAAAWASYHIVSQFYAGTQSGSNFLGIDFAIHSLLLIGLGWLIPWIISHKLRPSLIQAAQKGLLQGINSGTAKLRASLELTFQDLSSGKDKKQSELKELISTLDGLLKKRAV